jgi:hypothetical protein
MMETGLLSRALRTSLNLYAASMGSLTRSISSDKESIVSPAALAAGHACPTLGIDYEKP